MTSLGDTTGEPYVACLKKATCENGISVNFFLFTSRNKDLCRSIVLELTANI